MRQQFTKILFSLSQPVGGAYPAAGGAYPVAGPTVAVHSTNVIYTAQGGYGPDPVSTKCPYCQADIVTSTTHELGALVWIIVGSLFVAGFFILL